MRPVYKIILLLGLLLLLNTSMISARPEYAAKESRNCPFCHTRDGPPQLNEVGVYYGTHNHSLEGYVPSPKTTPTPEPTKEIEIGVHMNTWDVGLSALATILAMLVIVYAIRL
ncbi:MAG: hypothetical protein OIN88_06010 [Candidatus Methanoperedens sp.]|nr:hypothetical protein [Candidatus Methanoperedens sp.]MCZ7359306.1 hypothetical protein [Candidatus Methanoperedens sp.]HLB71781.1 hypothetical protein [Candidatus Methanoperedens sp.]